ncbi:MAG: hypothetical protein R3F34_16800 [Planctomycetota bacterium]
MPTLYEHALAALAHRYRTFARIYTRRRLRHDVGWVLSDRPIDTDMISGCCLFMRRGTVDALGGEPMDAAFPLYYEDTDLCRRVKRLGLRVMHAGNAPVVHHWSRSAGAGAIFEGEPRRRYRISQDLYFRRYYGAPGAAFARWCNRRSESWAGREESSLHDFVQLGECSGPPTFEWGGRRKYLIEASYIPNFMLAGAIVGEGESYTMSSGTWDWMFPGRVFVRLLDPEDLSFVKAWTFTKTTEPRDVPLALHEVFGADARVAPEVSR